MGVWGLLSFVQMHNPPLGQQISFTQTHDIEREPLPIIVIDGNALAYHLFQHCEECCWWDGGELRDFEASVRRWINEVQGSGIRLRCVLDGMLDPLKEETAVIRVRCPLFRPFTPCAGHAMARTHHPPISFLCLKDFQISHLSHFRDHLTLHRIYFLSSGT